ncbi:calcium/sodium antiporter [Tahibacter sp.]|uniref:calcium/sodium antiporter n=1 Tax=Tahibacter sp. TaxID=2056211 RepID=UPI0028C41D60|nr:calcium/sodium antiporter [Tahibacter sp.]
MLYPILTILAGLALLAVGAEVLVRGSSSIALRLGVTPLVIGLTIVAFGTGTPELLVSIEAASTGNSGLALGNIVGSNISNVALILGCAALARPLRVRSILLRREVPLMIVVTLLLCVMLLDGGLSRLDGAILLLGSIVYTVGAYVFAKRDRSREVAAEYSDAMPPVTRASWIDMLYIVGGLVALMLGAKLLVSGATVVAVALGMNQVVIGLTVVAIGTSMPELATSVVAALKDETDVAFGNVLGSNILNILCILGLVALIQPFGAEGLTTLDLAVLAGSAIVLLPLMSRGSILNRWEGAGLLVGYVIYVGILVSR